MYKVHCPVCSRAIGAPQETFLKAHRAATRHEKKHGGSLICAISEIRRERAGQVRGLLFLFNQFAYFFFFFI